MPNINLLIGSFYAYLTDQEIKESRYRRGIRQLSFHNNNNNGNCNEVQSIQWIEKLLQTPLPDHRRNCIWRILVPYLVNVRKLSYEESFSTIANWLDSCSRLRRLHFNPKSKIKQDLDSSTKSKKKYFPIGLAKLNSVDNELYNFLQEYEIIIDV